MMPPTMPVGPAAASPTPQPPVPNGAAPVPAPLPAPGTADPGAGSPTPLATVPDDGKLQERLPPEKISNPFERTATMIVQTAEDWAQRLAQNLGEHPTDTAPADPTTIQEMYHFSPYGTDAPMQFWREHDQLLQMAMENHDPDPYAVAERGALDSVYPYRSKLALLDSLGPDQRVQRAEQLQQISHRQSAAGNPPESLPSIVGPAGLPPAQPNGGT